MAMTDGFVRRGFRLVGAALPRRVRTRPRLRIQPAPAAALAPPAADQGTVAQSLAAAVASPLGHLVATAELLLDTPLGPLQQSYARSIAVFAEEIRAGVDRLLGRAVDAEIGPVDVCGLLRAVACLLAVPAKEGGVDVAVQAEAGIPHLNCDPVALRQLVVQLAADAMQRTGSGTVTLRALRVACGVRIVVVDGDTKHDIDRPDTGSDTVLAGLAAALAAEIDIVDSVQGRAVSLTVPLPSGLYAGSADAVEEGGPTGVEALMQRLSRELMASA